MNSEVKSETNAEEQKTPVENNQLSQQNTQQLQSQPETDKDINWRKFREQREIERKQKVEAERIAAEERARAQALQAALEASLNRPQQQYQQNQYQEKEETEEQRIAKHVELAIAKRDAQYEKQRLEKEQQELPQKLQSNFTDFNKICSTENLDYLEYHYPEVASAFKQLPDSYDKWSSIYKSIKRFVPNPDSLKDQKKAEANFKKPQSMSSPSTTQPGKDVFPNRISEERKAENWARMNKERNRLS